MPEEEKTAQKTAPEQKAPAEQRAPQEQKVQQLDGFLAEVVEVIRIRTGIYGEIRQVMCKIMEGPDKGRVIRRNLAGRIKQGDMIRLPDTSREDKPIRAR